jgi:single-stranded DNA-binding protein
MNSCVLMAKVVRNPQLRYTQDNQLAVCEMMVEFENPQPNTPPCNLKVVGWGVLATEMEQKYREGSQAILTGRLQMNVFDRQEGFKEKRAEFIVSHLYLLDSSPKSNVVDMNAYKAPGQPPKMNPPEPEEDFHSYSDTGSELDSEDSTPVEGNNLDNVPF